MAGAIIGLERQIAGKPVGVRTSALICFGTYIFIQIGSTIEGATDPSRVLGQVVTGIGFLGAGVMMSREGVVVGVTSAASIWMLAGIGATIGFGYFQVAIVISVLVVAVLVGVNMFEHVFKSLQRGVHEPDE
jgi:putative Mg2+ transporter-C (MgtC) family protein